MLRVRVFNAHGKRRVSGKNRIGSYVRRVLRSAGIKRAEVSVVFVDSKYSRHLNRLYLKHDFVTDVISFPLDRGRTLEGEVYVNLDRARSQATEFGVSAANEIARLVIHGVLHLVGYDDTGSRKAKRMRAEEEHQMQFWYN